MSTINKMKRPRKHKRKVASNDHAEQLKQLEKRESLCMNMTPLEREAITKEKRGVKNRMAALKSRQNKRIKLDDLHKMVQRLQGEVDVLMRENQALRQSRSSFPALHVTENTTCQRPNRKRNRPSHTLLAPHTTKNSNENPRKRPSLPSSQSSLSSVCSERQNMSTPVQPCTHNCGSAVSTPRVSHSLVAEQYSHLLWEMPWKTLRLIFSALWMISKTLISTTTAKDFLQVTSTYKQMQRSLREHFSRALIASSQRRSSFEYEKECGGNVAESKQQQQRQADNIFDRISRKFLVKAALSVARHG